MCVLEPLPLDGVQFIPNFFADELGGFGRYVLLFLNFLLIVFEVNFKGAAGFAWQHRPRNIFVILLKFISALSAIIRDEVALRLKLCVLFLFSGDVLVSQLVELGFTLVRQFSPFFGYYLDELSSFEF